VDAHDRRSGVDVAHHQGDGSFDPDRRHRHAFTARLRRNRVPLKSQDAEVSPAGREVRVSYLSNCLQRHG
jgi:hypothetical protein